jgi:hypothetical protein
MRSGAEKEAEALLDIGKADPGSMSDGSRFI